jgi:hypothetical protein
MIGKIRIWIRAHGYGLIETPNGSTFKVYRRDVPHGANLRRGEVVIFDPPRPGGRRVRAVQIVRPAPAAEPSGVEQEG